jgi:CDP-glycerol glycerophosphotransferase
MIQEIQREFIMRFHIYRNSKEGIYMLSDKIKYLFNTYGFWNTIIILIAKIFYKISCPLIINIIKILTEVKDNRILFQSFPDFSDNARALFDYMLSNNYTKKYEIIWLVRNPADYKKFSFENVTFVKATGIHRYLTFKALFYSLTSKLIFFTHTFDYKKVRKEQQTLVNLWHGCGYKAAKNAIEGKFEDSNFDYALVPGKLFIKTKAAFWGCSQDKILPICYPRYKWFFNSNIKSPLTNISNVHIKKTIIWMPTYRKTESKTFNENSLELKFEIPIISSIEEFKQLNEYCKNLNINIIIKRHPKQVKYNISNFNFSNIYFLTNEQLEKEDIQLYEVLSFVDALITDYSSVAIDFLLLDKPIGFTLEDLDKYKDVRGFVFDKPLQYMPGDHIYIFEDLLKFIKNIAYEIDDYKDHRANVKQLAHNPTKDYCNRILKYFNLTLDK